MVMPRILVVDDEPLIGMLLEDWLAELGYETVGPATSLGAALALIEGARLDAAIIDVSLGQQSGYPVAAALSARGIPFAFATGHAGGALEVPYDSAPVLFKPFDYQAVKGVMAAMNLRMR